MENKLRLLPGVDKIMENNQIKELTKLYSRDLILSLVRENLDFYRAAIMQEKDPPRVEDIVINTQNQVEALVRPRLRPLINATGVILHTNLGRAPLSQDTIEAMSRISGSYNNLEFDLETGTRGSRYEHIETLLCRLTGAEAGLVVNNNAAAVLLGLSALAKRKEVIVSRGQAVEIGGGFRIPEVMRQSGAVLVEVGTTNCTYIRDYEQGISPKTVALLRIHSSNFRVIGYTHMVGLEEMIDLGGKYGIPVLDDLGSGCLLDTAQFGLSPEPTIQDSIAKGVELVFFSGDKLLGGPQSGIIAGKKSHIEKLKKHPLIRAMRVDKTRLAGLAATLTHYLKGEALQCIPVWQMISSPLSEVEQRARHWAESLEGTASVTEGQSLIGGGSLPGATLPTYLVAIGKTKNAGLARKMARVLRLNDPPVIGRIEDNIFLLDPRSVAPGEDIVVVDALRKILQDAWVLTKGSNSRNNKAGDKHCL